MKINNLLSQITESDLDENNTAQMESLCKNVKQYYEEAEFNRHLYSEVSDFIYKMHEENFEYLIKNLSILKQYCINNKQYKEYAININKLIDHIKLEMLRINYTEKRQKTYLAAILNKSKSETKSLKDTIDKIKDDYKKQKNEVDKWYSNVVSILGIFSAIIIAFFGGLSVLGSSLENINKVGGYKLIFVILVIAFIMFNVIFMLLHVISKLTHTPIHVECSNKHKCKDCTEGKISIDCLREKFPIVYWYNKICVILIVSDYIMFIADKYNIISYVLRNFKPDFSVIGIVGLGILTILILECIIWYKHKDKK